MAIFKRNRGRDNAEDNGGEAAAKKEKGSWRKPANTAFKQQRLKAWQPILTPKTVLPTLLVIAIIFAPIGGLLIWGSGLVTEITLDYTSCENQQPSASNTSLSLFNVPNYSYRLRSGHTNAPVSTPQFAFVDRSSDSSVDVSQQKQCIVQFDVPYDLDHTVLLYYKLTNFFQNHRRYVKSIDMNQLKGDFVSPSDLNKGDCKPITTINGKAVYPCGLIANSVFNDTYSNLTLATGGSTLYQWSEKGIAWPGEADKYAVTPDYNIDDIVPPPNWADRFPGGVYNSSQPPPNLKEDEHFQNWMRTAGLPTFTKLWGRNDNDNLLQGRYQITVNLSA
ncbi:hypothetical protein EW026_g3052 [Hermanssonia centrifuga]|uniref:Cell cycle control protein n=1 Tax=Hermanssonia centrifuga TaxID=98765 RepID=A0A4S4KNA8_9APHY|nr:hypothetical protein EW026_g3052 [Hermanssonia centrifuga]